MIKFRQVPIFALLLLALTCEIKCACKWENFYFPPGYTSHPDVKFYCHEDIIDSLENYEAKCDSYIDLDMKECYEKNWLGFPVASGRYVYKVDIKVKNARSTNLFARDLNTYNGLRVRSLEVSGQLKEVPNEIYGLKYLEYIDLSQNHITSLQTSFFSVLPKLRTLDLSNNDISDVDTFSVSNKNNLMIWNLNHNRIRSFSINSLYNYQNLKNLYLSHNDIDSLILTDFEENLSLKVLDLSYNKLAAIDGYAFGKLSHTLEHLDVSHNRIKFMNSNNLLAYPKLSALLANNNQIEYIDDFKKLPELFELKLDHNKITNIPRTMFETNYKLYSITLNDNPIDKIESDSFYHNRKLSEIVLSNTRLTTVKEIAWRGYDNIKRSSLDLSRCKITEITNDTFAGVTGISNLNVSYNAIQTVSNSAFNHLSDLKKLDISHNQIETLDFNTKNLKKLREFHAQYNKIEKIHKSVFENLIALTDLDLSFNNIKEMDPMALENMKTLKNINLSYNKDFDVMLNSPFSELEYLEQMQIVDTGNTIYRNNSMTHCRETYRTNLNSAFGKVKQIEYNAFGNCLFLRYFNLSHNELETFQVNTTSIRYIKELNLANNHIQEINIDTFSELHDLETLNLANNDLVHVASNAFEVLPRLKYFYISSTVTPRKTLMLTGLEQHFEILSIGNFDLDMKFDDYQYYIKTLELKSCGIQDLSNIKFSNIHQLEQLNLDGNDLNIINHETLKGLSTVVGLSLSGNNISFILAGSFLNMNRLVNLDLSENKISSIFYGVLDGPENLVHLNLSSNSLQTLNVKVLPPTSYLYLDKNPLTTMNLNDVYNSHLNKISLGNCLSCDYLVNAKRESPVNFSKFVTADPPNFYIQNINGVPCQ